MGVSDVFQIVDLGVPRSSRGGGTNLFKSLRYMVCPSASRTLRWEAE